MKPSAPLSGAQPSRHARSTASQTSRGRSKPQLRYWERALWNSQSSPCFMASW
jgi:hypothetical protein